MMATMADSMCFFGGKSAADVIFASSLGVIEGDVPWVRPNFFQRRARSPQIPKRLGAPGDGVNLFDVPSEMALASIFLLFLRGGRIGKPWGEN